jgi:hypothetical protein
MAVCIEGARSVSNPLSASVTEMERIQPLHDIFPRLGSTAAMARSKLSSARSG